MHPELKLHLFERDPVLERLERVEPSAVANFSSWIVPLRETQSRLARARQEIDALLPTSCEAISFHPNVPAKEVVIRFRGIACLRWRESRIYFGARDLKTMWEPRKAAAVKKLFHELDKYRHPLASDTRHAMFRAQAERWLEFLVREDVTRFDATLVVRVGLAESGRRGLCVVLRQ